MHGSLEWFIALDGTVVSFFLTRVIPDTFQLLIIKEKYRSIHDEPYRTIIAEADKEEGIPKVRK